jgi:hypothetical protein
MSSYSSLALPYVRVAFPNGLLTPLYLSRVEQALLNEAVAFSNIYPSFPN